MKLACRPRPTWHCQPVCRDARTSDIGIAGARVASEFSIMVIRRRISARLRRVVEIPERGQSFLAARQPLEHGLSDLLGGSCDPPDADFIHGALEVRGRLIRGHALAEVKPVAVLQSREAAGVIVGAGQRAIQVKFHRALAGDGGDVTPLLRAKKVRDGNFVQLLLRIADDEPDRRRVLQRSYRNVSPGIAVIEHAFGAAAEIIPPHPRLDRGLVKVVENIRRQFDIAARAVEVEDVVGCGGLGAEKKELKEKADEEAKGGDEVAPAFGVRQSSGAFGGALDH